MDVSNFTPRIREILQTSDLATISAKKVRRQLEHEMNASLDSYKGEIDEIIKQQFQQIHNETQQRQQVQQQYAQQYAQQGHMGGVYHTMSGLQMPGGGYPAMPGGVPGSIAGSVPAGMPGSGAPPDGAPRKRGRPRKPENDRKQARKKRVLDPNRPKRHTGLSKPMKLSAKLGTFLDQKYCARTDVVKNLWKYIKEHNLQDPEDKRYILCDDKLKDIFQTERLYMYTMNKLLNDHLIKPTPEENAEAIVLLDLPPTHPAAADSVGIVAPGSVAAAAKASTSTSAAGDGSPAPSEDDGTPSAAASEHDEDEAPATPSTVATAPNFDPSIATTTESHPANSA
ncbi:hypothetical protein IW140_005489 [Coemansia sp. RSA 1813]|nr:hypothetical protein EV178_005833 [Coemansia sp. RSA 1646]KAJ1768639.1 hypothetical protein LPJ74_004700 [Coemansia sp. RSA 1843]KAJ2086567.1 hypothetical protein IW138_005608 [Coemansia sp. RSA 986]KAJ2211209.1 hypothetical protein EV179_005666 [Coemansia sp. RSA 487]KAJ2565058.1 hypothetical protein IW140_005489 [Coemansia sp. RSA 1813]